MRSSRLTVTLQDREEKYVAPAMERARKFFEKRYPDQAKRERSPGSPQDADVAGTGVPQADLVIEAIFENLEAKRELYARVEPQLKPNAVLATNTSSIVLEQLAEKLGATLATHRAALFQSRRAHAAGRSHSRARPPTRKRCRPASPSPGRSTSSRSRARARRAFWSIACLMPYLSEAVRAAQEGIPLALIDRAAEEFGMPMGPIELADVVGLDVVMSVGKVFFETGAEVPPVLSTRFSQKKFGKKTGEGFYVWQNDKPQKPPVHRPVRARRFAGSAAVAAGERSRRRAAAGHRRRRRSGRRRCDLRRGLCAFPRRPAAVRARRGVDAIVARLQELQSTHGDRFAPDEGWDLLR